MRTSFRDVADRTIGSLVAFLLLWTHTASATTYMSVEPVPNRDIVGEDNLAAIRSIGYTNLERWSQRLLDECRVADSVIDALSDNGAISSITSTNTHAVVAAGGFEGGTNPSFVFTVQDSGRLSDRGGRRRARQRAWLRAESGRHCAFQPGQFQGLRVPARLRPRDVLGNVERRQSASVLRARGHDRRGAVRRSVRRVRSRSRGSLTNNSMLFLQPAVSKRRFISGLSAAVEDDPRASYSPLKNNGAPTTARAGVAFPGNDWITFPDGDQYLANVGGSAQLLSELAALRQQHLAAVESLLEAIEGEEDLEEYVAQFTCPN